MIILSATSKCKFLGQPDNTSRFLLYWAKLFNDNIHKGQNYDILNKTILILLINYDDTLIDDIPKINTSWHIREDTYSKILLTELLEFHIISLKKLKNLASNNSFIDTNDRKKLITWLKFINNPNSLEVFEMENNKEIQNAKKQFDEIQQNDKELELAWLRQKYILEMNDAERYGINKGKKIGEKIGEKIGKSKGKKEEKIAIAKKLLEQNIDINIIIKATELTKDEIEKLLIKPKKSI